MPTPPPTLKGVQLPTAVLARLADTTFRIFDENDLVRAFYRAKLRAKGALDYLFQSYPFDVDSLSPHSRALHGALYLLQQGRMLRRSNPDLVEYSISSALQKRYERIKAGIEVSDTVKADLDQLAGLVKDILKERKPA